MEVLKEAMTKLSCDLQIYEEKREWSRWGLLHGGRAAIECKADKLRADAVERAVHYDSDATGYYDSDPEVVDMDVDYEERMMEEDVTLWWSDHTLGEGRQHRHYTHKEEWGIMSMRSTRCNHGPRCSEMCSSRTTQGRRSRSWHQTCMSLVSRRGS